MVLSDVKRGIPTDPRGRCSMAQIATFLNLNGFAASGVRIAPDAFDRTDSATVAVLFVDESHFIVTKPLGRTSLLVFDPPRPARVYEVDAMPYEWAGHAVLVARDPDRLSRELEHLGIQNHP
jgi:ABC-type bacteriocin/lantibiotic exporter with double-glycine peptidase domain